LEESEVSVEDVVEVDLRVVPGVIVVDEGLALVAPRHDVIVDGQAIAVDTVLEATAEQIDAHDAEDEPEDQTDEQYVEDGWDSLDQRVDHHLYNDTNRFKTLFLALSSKAMQVCCRPH